MKSFTSQLSSLVRAVHRRNVRILLHFVAALVMVAVFAYYL